MPMSRLLTVSCVPGCRAISPATPLQSSRTSCGTDTTPPAASPLSFSPARVGAAAATARRVTHRPTSTTLDTHSCHGNHPSQQRRLAARCGLTSHGVRLRLLGFRLNNRPCCSAAMYMSQPAVPVLPAAGYAEGFLHLLPKLPAHQKLSSVWHAAE